MPRAKKRQSTARPSDSAPSSKRLLIGSQAAPQFPLPADIRVLPVIDSEASRALQSAYGGVSFPDELLRVFEFCLSGASVAVAAAAKGAESEVLTLVDAFKSSLAPLGLQPCGPFDFLLCYGQNIANSDFDWLTHCRYAHDPPEFLTLFVAVGDRPGDDATSELHIGYVRDAPELQPAFLACNDSSVDGTFVRLGDNILQSLAVHAQRRARSLPSSSVDKQQRQLLQRLAKFCYQPLSTLDTASAQQPASGTKAAIRRPDKTSPPVVARTLNGLGLCVPLNSDGVGYRELPESDASLRRLLAKVAAKCDAEPDRQARLALLEPVDELVTLVQFANDEGDPGMGLELGLDLLSVPSAIGCYDDLIEGLLVTGYGLVGRQLYADIVRKHLPVRLRYRLQG